MTAPQKGSRFIVFAADDLGRSVSVNEAVFEAYESGLLTASSLMAGGDAFHQAAEALGGREGLDVGLHVTLCDGKAVLPHSDIPDLTLPDGSFFESPAAVWIGLSRKYLMAQAEREIEAQFDRLAAVGIKPCYVDSHHHLHMHPGLFGPVCRIAADRGVSWIRVPGEPARVVYGLSSGGRGLISFIEHAVFATLMPSNKRKAASHGLRCADRVYGLSHSGNITEEYLLALIESMAVSGGSFVNEIFCHPDKASAAGMTDLKALKSAAVAARLDSLGIKGIGYTGLL
jgi:chitin disaccharide deacetylase